MSPPVKGQDSTPPEASTKSFLARHRQKLILSAIITALIVYAMQKGGLSLIPERKDFAHVRWWAVAAYLVPLVGMSYFRAVRWRFLLRPMAEVPRRRLLAVSWIGFAAILLLPFRLGEFVRPLMIRQKGRISGSAATGTVVAERVVDGLYLSTVLAAALVLVPHVEPLPEKVVGLNISVAEIRYFGFLMLGVFVCAFTVIGVYYFARTWAHRITLAVFGLFSKRLAEKLAGMAERLADGLHLFSRGRDSLGFLFETSAYWALNACGMWLLAWGCGVVHADGSPINFGEACALMGMLGITILIPGPPGLLGTFQAGIYAGMTMYFPTSVVTGQGAAYVFLLYLVQCVWQIGSALFFLIGDRTALREFSAAQAAEPRDIGAN